jgi:hypothetical protein
MNNIKLVWVTFLILIVATFLFPESLNKLHLDFDPNLYTLSGICLPSLNMLVLSDVTFVSEKSLQRPFLGPLFYKSYWDSNST